METQEGEILLRGRGIFQEVGGSSEEFRSGPRDQEEAPRDSAEVKCSFVDGGRGYWDAEDIPLSGWPPRVLNETTRMLYRVMYVC